MSITQFVSIFAYALDSSGFFIALLSIVALVLLKYQEFNSDPRVGGSSLISFNAKLKRLRTFFFSFFNTEIKNHLQNVNEKNI